MACASVGNTIRPALIRTSRFLRWRCPFALSPGARFHLAVWGHRSSNSKMIRILKDVSGSAPMAARSDLDFAEIHG